MKLMQKHVVCLYYVIGHKNCRQKDQGGRIEYVHMWKLRRGLHVGHVYEKGQRALLVGFAYEK